LEDGPGSAIERALLPSLLLADLACQLERRVVPGITSSWLLALPTGLGLKCHSKNGQLATQISTTKVSLLQRGLTELQSIIKQIKTEGKFGPILFKL
jgi:hypothetical protein